MSEVVMYCTRFCPYCISADRLLTHKGVPIKKIAVDHDPDLWAKMEKLIWPRWSGPVSWTPCWNRY